MRRADVLVVGGGAIGCAIAWAVARRGAEVVVLERDEPGAHASGAAAGMLSPLAEAEGPGAFLSLLLAARDRFSAVSRALLEETGVDVGYRDDGTLAVALTAEDEGPLETRFRWQSAAGLPVQRLTAREARGLEPALSPALRWALRFEGDHQVDSRRFSRALWLAAIAAGAEFLVGSEARELVHDGARAAGVRLADGDRVLADRVVLAAGSWSGRLGNLPRPVPVRPVHGQLLALEAVSPLLRHVINTPRVYLVPRSDGRVVVGATVDESGFRTRVRAAGSLRLLEAAIEAAPALADHALTAQWAGLRPGTPDGLPILGPDPDVEGLLYATGHYRNGILLAPLTGELVGALALHEPPAHDLGCFSIGRFER